MKHWIALLLSFPRRRESIRIIISEWIPAYAGMTVLVLLCACTPQVQDFHAPTQAAHMDVQALHMDDGASLPYQRWLPAGKPKAVIIALHGFNDYSHAFAYSGEFFKAHGIALYAYDQRGFGRTEHIGIWAGEENLVSDLKQFIRQLQKKYAHTPLYILGESMGGAVAIIAASDPDFPRVQGLILSAPAVWGAEAMNPVFRSTLWLAAHTIPFREFTGSDLKVVACSNHDMLVSMYHDPLVLKKTRVDAVYGVVHLMGSAYEKVPDIRTPTLLLYGAHDQVIPPSPIKNATHRFSVPMTYGYYPQGYHMLLRDLDREVEMEDILSWIHNPHAELPSGFGEVITH